MAESFDQAAPHYIAMGMTATEFWDGDSELVKDYRAADVIRQERDNASAWLQGMYFFEAISVALTKAFSKSANSIQYTDKPYDLGIRKKRMTKAQANEEKLDNTVSFLHRLTNQFNAQNARKKERELEQQLRAGAKTENIERTEPGTNSPASESKNQSGEE